MSGSDMIRRKVLAVKRYIPLAFLLAAVGGCGQFTNVPAQIHVKSVDVPAAITYAFDATTRTTVATVANPKITLEGELGSIGITYDTMTITYFTANGRNSVPGTGTKTDGSTDIRFSIRVPTSHLNRDSNGIVNAPAASGSVEIPIINPVVTKWGETHFLEGNLSAAVTLNGIDDASFPRSLDINLPIALQGNVGRAV